MPRGALIRRYVRRALKPYGRSASKVSRRSLSSRRTTGSKRSRTRSYGTTTKRRRVNNDPSPEVGEMGHTDLAVAVPLAKLPLSGNLRQKQPNTTNRVFIFGDCNYYTNAPGEQRMIWFPTFTKSVFTAMGVQDNTIDGVNENCFLKEINHQIEYVNNSNNMARVTIYNVVCRRTVGNNPVDTIDTGITDNNMGGTHRIPFTYPEQVERFNIYYKIVDKKEVCLPSGGAGIHTFNRKMNKVVNPVMLNALEHTADFACGILYVYHGFPVRATTNPTQVACCVGPTSIIFAQTGRITYRTAENNDQFHTVANRTYLTGANALSSQVMLADTDTASIYNTS